MRNSSQIGKWLAVGIILLFIETCIVPSTGDFTILKEIDNDACRDYYTRVIPPEEEWNRTFGGQDDDRAYQVQQTSDGGYIVVGFKGPQYGQEDVLLVKTDGNGTMEWNRTFGGRYQDIGYSVQQTSDGGYIVVGSTYNHSVGSIDLWMIKTDENGNEQWNKRHGGAGADGGSSVKQTTDGGYIMTGFTRSYGWVGTYDVWLIKTDENGTEQWNHTWGSPSTAMSDEGNCVEQTPDGGYIIVGDYAHKNPYDTDWDVFLIKTDEYGIEEWNRTYGDDEMNDLGQSVKVAPDGGYIIAGLKGIHNQWCDAWLIKTDQNGTEQWNKTFGKDGYDNAYSVSLTANGGYVLTGEINEDILFDRDVLLVETDCDGNTLWNKTLGKPGDDNDEIGYSVLQTSDGGYIVAGMTTSYGAGASDFWLIKFDRFYYPPNPPLITGPTSGDPGVNYNFTVTATDYEQEDIYYWIEWGDTTNSGWIGPYPSGSPAVLNHTFLNPGRYGITAKAKDSNGNEGFWSDPHKILIGNSAPEQPQVSGPYIGKTNTKCSFSIGTIIDPDGDQFYCYWVWGDGNSSGWLGPYNSGTIVNLSHEWNKSGTYTIKVKLKDIWGAESNWSTQFSITIVELKMSFFLGAFTNLNQTEDLLILESKFFIIFPSDQILVTGKKVVISTGAFMGLGSRFIFGIGKIAVL